MNVRSSSVIVACALLLSAASPAAAQVQPVTQRKKALELFDRGKIQYDLGRWEQAIDLWMQAYETFDAPEFLFNIAQAYRHKGDCEQGSFFYRRYLATKPNARNRGEVEKLIVDLDRKCKDKPASGPDEPATGHPPTGGKPPATTERGVPGPGGAEGRGDTGEESEPGGEGRDVADASDTGDEGVDEESDVEDGVKPRSGQARLFAVRVAVGPSFPSLGNLDVGTLVSITGGVAHPIYIGDIVLEPGALVTYTPIPWEVENADPPRSGTAALTGLMANLGAGMEFLPGLSGRAEAGLGALIFSGLTETGNPFLDMNDFADGPIALFHVRGALGVEYAITDNILIHAEPVVFSFSPSRPLREDIESVTRFEMLVGAGYRM